ncbi:hypothetical protein AKJ53_00495 [candidate division MSBL1 archaeon SCGC-AAA382F02]|uniref:uroporphyrinogen-III C-methyltransferase n=1 Tax=candidate division MSBL1 archaeon SCGC-AAA382F02 TaxID=1698282 RepID=A0A133VIW2_9EURY|nr:hypothetical protein AKJ53_00495 [candidate division MSBL1 archaeon SCGC-AAA382F02]
MKGKVYLVGCGPGAPDLLTLRAVEVLQEADVVLFDRLVDSEVLGHAENAEKIDVGKEPGESEKQREINQLIYSKAEDGKVVVRLKNGNPAIFARGGEELRFLRKRGIAVEIVPGLSSATSLPPIHGIPLTMREVSSSLSILSGYGAGGEEPRWREVGNTDVVLMTVGNLSRVVDRLLESGRSEETSCALIISGTTERERLLVSSLSEVTEMAEEVGVEPPAILIVGDVVDELLDLEGRTLAAFRPGREVERTESLVEEAGASPKIYSICEVDTSANSELAEALEEEWDVLVFMSSNGVRSAAELTDIPGRDVIAIGERTKAELEKLGCETIILPETRSSKGVEELLEGRGWKALALRSSMAEEDIECAKNVVAYSVEPRDVSGVLEDYLAEEPDFTLLTSSGVLKLLLEAAEEEGREERLEAQLDKTFLISLGRRTTRTALANDIWINYELPRPNLEDFFRGNDQ